MENWVNRQGCHGMNAASNAIILQETSTQDGFGQAELGSESEIMGQPHFAEQEVSQHKTG